jgi:hypothetical protein
MNDAARPERYGRKNLPTRFHGVLIFLWFLNVAQKGQASNHSENNNHQDLASWRGRKTFSRTGICGGGGILKFESPRSDATIERGPIEIILSSTTPHNMSATHNRNEWYIDLWWKAFPQTKDEKIQHIKAVMQEDGKFAPTTLDVLRGVYVMDAELRHATHGSTGCYAHMRFSVTSSYSNHLSAALNVCAGDTDEEGLLALATSLCAPLLQLAHEKRLQGAAQEARAILTQVVALSAMKERRRDSAHVLHIYPYRKCIECAVVVLACMCMRVCFYGRIWLYAVGFHS